MDWLTYPLGRRIFARQTNRCESAEGQGRCIPQERCVGISTPDLCPNDPEGVQCCLVRECRVPIGNGTCRSVEMNGCPEGEFFPGTAPPWPCPGSDDIQCCVRYSRMITASSTQSTSSTTSTSAPAALTTTIVVTQTPTTSTSTPFPTPTAPPADSSLSGGQIGGVTVGVLAAAGLFIGAIILVIIRRRRAKREEETRPADAGQDEEKKLPPELSSPVEKKTDLELLGSTPHSPADDYVADRKEPLVGRLMAKGPTELAGAASAPPAELEAVEAGTRPVEADSSK